MLEQEVWQFHLLQKKIVLYSQILLIIYKRRNKLFLLNWKSIVLSKKQINYPSLKKIMKKEMVFQLNLR